MIVKIHQLLLQNQDQISIRVDDKIKLFQSESEIDDLITLRGGGQITQWRFPKIKCCPIRRCPAQFESRTRAISHYKKHHAKHYIYCSICDKPIQVQNFQCFARHYDRNHLGIEVPIHVSEPSTSRVYVA